MGTWRTRKESEKTWAERMSLAHCTCGHPNTLHAGGIGDCAFLLGSIELEQCPCQEFRDVRDAANTPATPTERVTSVIGGNDERATPLIHEKLPS